MEIKTETVCSSNEVNNYYIKSLLIKVNLLIQISYFIDLSVCSCFN